MKWSFDRMISRLFYVSRGRDKTLSKTVLKQKFCQEPKGPQCKAYCICEDLQSLQLPLIFLGLLVLEGTVPCQPHTPFSPPYPFSPVALISSEKFS